MRHALFFLIVVCGVCGDESEQLRDLARRLRNLRQQCEAKRRQLLQRINRVQQEVNTKKRLLLSVRKELVKVRESIRKAEKELRDMRVRKDALCKEEQAFYEHLEAARSRFNKVVVSSIPFRRAERTIPPQKSLSRLFDAVVEAHLNDILHACSLEAYRDILRVGERRLRGYMVRIGLVGMAFAGDGGEAAIWTNSGWEVSRNVRLWRAIRRLAEQSLKRAVPKIVPTPLPSEAFK